MIGLCTNVLLRWLLDVEILPDDAPRQRSRAHSLLSDRSQTFFVNHMVLAETAWILNKKLKVKRTRVVDLVDKLLSAANIVVQDEDVVQAALASYAKGSADLADELIAHVNDRAGCLTTLTFDKDAAKSSLFTLAT